MKNLLIIILLSFCGLLVHAQKYYTKEGHISFSSDAPLEKIEANNHKASSVMDVENGNIQWAVLIKAFEFEKALMQEHFNENYMESSKYPKAKFIGKILNIESILLDKKGEYLAQVEGSLEIHGVIKDIQTQATFIVDEAGISAASEFKVLVADFGIEIPAVVKENIAKEVIISIQTQYKLLEK